MMMKKITKFIFFSLLLWLFIFLHSNVHADDELSEYTDEEISDMITEWMKNITERIKAVSDNSYILEDLKFWSIWHEIYDRFMIYERYIKNIREANYGGWYTAFSDVIDSESWYISSLRWNSYDSTSEMMLINYLKNSSNLEKFYLWTGTIITLDKDSFIKFFDFWKFFNHFQNDDVYKMFVWYLSYNLADIKKSDYTWIKWVIYRIFLMNSEKKLFKKIPGTNLTNVLPSSKHKINLSYRRWKYLMHDFQRKFICDYNLNKFYDSYYCSTWIDFEQSRNYIIKNTVLNWFVFILILLTLITINRFKNIEKIDFWLWIWLLIWWGVFIVFGASLSDLSYKTLSWAAVWTSLLFTWLAFLAFLIIIKLSSKYKVKLFNGKSSIWEKK